MRRWRPRPKSQNRLQESGPLMAKAIRDYKKILPAIISTLALQMEPKGRRTNAKSMRVKERTFQWTAEPLAWCKLPFTILQVSVLALGFGLPYLATASLLGGTPRNSEDASGFQIDSALVVN
ncbi:hypothetical protein AAY473_016771 [Plecturocebus cupreus]